MVAVYRSGSGRHYSVGLKFNMAKYGNLYFFLKKIRIRKLVNTINGVYNSP